MTLRRLFGALVGLALALVAAESAARPRVAAQVAVLTPATVERNIANGHALTAQATATAPRTRQKYRLKYRVWRPATQIALVYSNRFMAAGADSAGSTDIGIVKASVGRDGNAAAVTFRGARSATVTAGTTLYISDWVNYRAVPGEDLWVRGEADFVASANAHLTAPLNIADGETSYIYDPANEVDDVDGSGALGIPTGAGANSQPWRPIMLIGRTSPASAWSWIGGVTSIELGLRDETSAGAAGGGYLSRAAYTVQSPYFAYSLNGGRWGRTATILSAVAPYHEAAFLGGATNDIQNGSTDAQTIALMRVNYALLRGAGVRRILQGKIIPRGSATSNKGATPAGMTVAAQFGDGEYRDTVNDALAVDPLHDGFVDVSTVLEDAGDHTKFRARTFSTTLAAAMASGAVTASLVARPDRYEALVFDPANANTQLAPSTFFVCRSEVTGSGPYSCNTANATTVGVAQDSGNAVVGVTSYDVVHPLPLPYVDMATPTANAMRTR